MDIKSKCRLVKLKNINSLFNIQALQSLAERVIGAEYKEKFVFEKMDNDYDGNDKFSINCENGRIFIRAANTISAASALNTYLKKAGCHYSLLGCQLNLPSDLPMFDTVSAESPFLYRYFLNFCTYGYTFAYWQWEDYEKLIDYMALSGINLALNIVGFEEVWRRTLLKIGYSEADIHRFFVGANYLPWLFMGNMSGFADDLPDGWFEDRIRLGRRIKQRMDELGIGMLVPGYSGMIPGDYAEHFPNSKIIVQGDWCGMTRPDILAYDDENYLRIAEYFYESIKQVYGDDIHYFSLDPFHEGGSCDNINLAEYAVQTQGIMQRCFPESVAVFQGWQSNPKREILNGMDKKYVLVLNLLSDVKETTDDDNFADSPWLFGTVNNYGGNSIARGNFRLWTEKPFEILNEPDRTMVGIGLLPEGICCDQLMFEIFTDIGFMDSPPDRTAWLEQYLTRRYGKCDAELLKAFEILTDNVYAIDAVEGTRESAVCARPSLNVSTVGTWGSSKFGYDTATLEKAVRILYSRFDEFKESYCFKFDFIDLLRQCLSNKSWSLYENIKKAFEKKNTDDLNTAAEEMFLLIRLEEELVANREDLLLGNYLKAAKALGSTEAEKQKLEFSARTQITLWGDKSGAEFLRDYCQREWHGMLSDFYLCRWQRFVKELKDCIAEEKEYSDLDWYDFDYKFTVSQKEYPVAAKQNLPEVCKKIFSTVLKERGELYE
ncbi:MAG: alpha-N-acetylglucosaminidase [Acutalibacteraceae bacterium]